MTTREILEETHLSYRQLTYAAASLAGPLILFSAVLNKPWTYIGFAGAILGIWASINAGTALYKAGYKSRGLWLAGGVTVMCLFVSFLLASLS